MRTRRGFRQSLRSATAWHAISLAVGMAFIMWLQRSQWFFFDEWAFLEPHHVGLFAPHVGHWSTSPMAVFIALRSVLGLGSYFPFALIVTVIHLAVSHLVWRISIRAGARPWIATGAAAVVVVLGAGSENILWAFQIGFLGALALGLLAFLLAMSPRATTVRLVAIFAIALFSLTWSGTAIPLVVATTAMLWRRSGARHATGFAAVTGLTYVGWYVAFALGSPTNPDTGGLSLTKIFIKIPEFIGVMLILGFQTVFPIPGMGIVVLLGLLLWLIRLHRTKARIADFSPAVILTATAALFAFMTAYSRAGFSVGGGRSSRYVYLVVVLLLPLCALALTRLSLRSVNWRRAVAASLGVLVVYQGFGLAMAAQRQAEVEQASRRVISAALSLEAAHPDQVDTTLQPDPANAPDATLADLVWLHDRGQLPITDFGQDDLESARAAVEPPG